MYPSEADPMTVQDHPSHNFSDRVQLAGDVISFPDVSPRATTSIRQVIGKPSSGQSGTAGYSLGRKKTIGSGGSTSGADNDN